MVKRRMQVFAWGVHAVGYISLPPQGHHGPYLLDPSVEPVPVSDDLNGQIESIAR